MPPSQVVQWVALPNGVIGEGADRKVRLSVFVAPRLRADEQHALLASFPDFLDWPSHVQPGEISFDVVVENGPQMRATVVSQRPDPDLWDALFTDDTPVESFITPDNLADRPIVTFPVREVQDYLKDKYVEVARTSTDDLPGIFARDGDGERGRGALDAIFGDLVHMFEPEPPVGVTMFHGGNGFQTVIGRGENAVVDPPQLPLQGIFYVVNTNGNLHWYQYKGNGEEDPKGERRDLWEDTSRNPIRPGFEEMKHILGCGDGVIIAVHANGNLHWYQYNSDRNVWHEHSGKQIASGWQNFRHIFVRPRAGRSGRLEIFAVAQNGALLWHSYDSDSDLWHEHSGKQIASGWQNFRHIHANHRNEIFGVHENGALLWHKYNSDGEFFPGAGDPQWIQNSGNQIRNDLQNMQHVFGGLIELGGFGHVIMAVDQNGDLFWYKYAGSGQNDPAGSQNWHQSSGHKIGNLAVLLGTSPPVAPPPESGNLLANLQDGADLSRRISSVLERARSRASERALLPASERPKTEPPIEPLPAGDDPQSRFSKVTLFHRRPTDSRPVDLPKDEEAEEHFREKVDFHQLLSALGDYPHLLRRLGLVFDLELAAGDLPETPAELENKKLRVIPIGRPPDSNPSPWTVYRHTTLAGVPHFIPAPRPAPRNENRGGLWTLSSQNFALAQVDVDGAAIKALNMASTLAQQAAQLSHPIDTPDKAGVASLRTSGIALVRSGHAQNIHNDFVDALRNDSEKQPVTLHAEDLTRGYRFDVWDDGTRKWHSLHQRIGTYRPLNHAGGAFDIADEGFFQFSVTEPAKDKNAPPNPNAELYIHEALVTWDGWSLSAPRPSKSINRNPNAPDPEDPDTQPERPPNQAMTSMQLEVTFKALPGSLPRLRFGRTYRCRMRTVDLAGNSPTLEKATASVDSMPDTEPLVLPRDNALLYSRFEPVNAPALVPRAVYSEGESLERMVIRSNFDDSAEEYAKATRDKFGIKYSATNDRHVAAPKASQQLVETHGMLDEAFDAKLLGLPPGQVKRRVRTAYEIARKEKGSLNDTSQGADTIFVPTSDPEGTEGYTVHREEHLQLPYLPDPIAEGAVFTGLPGTAPGSSFEELYDRDPWHAARPFRLRLAEGRDAPEWDAAARLLTVQLPPAAVATVRVNSRATDGFFKMMGLFQWCEEAHDKGTITDQEFDAIHRAVAENRHWMFTPWRELTLVHAVQQPLEPPAIDAATLNVVDRGPASTRAHFEAVPTHPVLLHGPSTSRLDLVAEWREPRDDPSEERPFWGDEMIQAQAQVFDFAVPAPGQELNLMFENNPALEYREDRRLTFDTLSCEKQRDTLQKDPNDTNFNTLAQLRPHEFGDTKYRKVRYRFVATTRFREYFAPEITENPGKISRESNEIELHILNSAPPAAPKLLYIIPTFKWERGTDATGKITTSTRRGGGLRVYLDRPWFSSGEGELLGLVLKEGGTTPITPASPSYPYVTCWGQDPTWKSAPLASPTKASFKNAVHVGEGLQLHELRDKVDDVVTVVGFAVQFDEGRGLWYSDIEFDTKDAYFPFVRLALVRYQPNSIVDAHLQPNSIGDAHLSPVVLADTVQTAPDRVMVVTRGDVPGSGISVTVSGPAYRAAPQPDDTEMPLTTEMEAHFERRNRRITDDALGWEPLAEEVSRVTLTPSVPAEDGEVTWAAQLAGPSRHELDLASTTMLTLLRVGIDFSVPEADLREWLNDRENTPYPALAEALLKLLEGNHLPRCVPLDVIRFKYEDKDELGAPSPRSVEDVDFEVLREAVLRAYNERHGEAERDFQRLVRRDEAPDGHAPDSASATMLTLLRVGIDFSVPEADLREWLNDRENTPYPALAEALLKLLEGNHLPRCVPLDVIRFKYEDKDELGAPSPRSVEDVDFEVLREAVLRAYNERHGEAERDFQRLVRSDFQTLARRDEEEEREGEKERLRLVVEEREQRLAVGRLVYADTLEVTIDGKRDEKEKERDEKKDHDKKKDRDEKEKERDEKRD